MVARPGDRKIQPGNSFKEVAMKKMLLLVLSAGAALTIVSSAQASGGCGPAFHRGPYGGCRPNVGPGPVVVGVGGPGIGVFYAGRGYWDGHRYWHNRYRWNGGWRYR
jgi:hypothetical protein